MGLGDIVWARLPDATMGVIKSWFSVPPPDRSVPRWHVSPGIDVSAYAFSWVWVLVPMVLLFSDGKDDYYGIYIVILAATEVHRHYGLPYVYLDRETFSRFRLRFTLLPSVLFVVWATSPWFVRHAGRLSVVDLAGIAAGVVLLGQLLRRDQDGAPPDRRKLLHALAPSALVLGAGIAWGASGQSGWWWLAAAGIGSVRVDLATPPSGRRWVAAAAMACLAFGVLVAPGFGVDPASVTVKSWTLMSFIAVAAGTWNVWHVLMQKYGILRMYNAKSGNKAKVPGWVDRLLVFGWFPLLILTIGSGHRAVALREYRRGATTLTPLLDTLDAVQSYLLVPAAALVAIAIIAFVLHERRANGLRNAPRLWMAAGTTLLSASFFFFHPLKVFLAFGFSHAVEYMVFVWAFQRRRYNDELPHKPLLARILRKPLLAYGGFIVGGSALVIVLKYYGRTIFESQDQPYFLGFKTSEWMMYWGTYQSLMHFYFDGFLWKMRKKSTRAHI